MKKKYIFIFFIFLILVSFKPIKVYAWSTTCKTADIYSTDGSVYGIFGGSVSASGVCYTPAGTTNVSWHAVEDDGGPVNINGVEVTNPWPDCSIKNNYGNLTVVTGYSVSATYINSGCAGVGGYVEFTFSGPDPAPACSYAGPDNDTFYVNTGSVRRYAYGVSNATSVYFPTWSTTNGQDDLIWYPGTNAGGGTWYVDIPLANHPPANSTGDSMNVHVYMNNSYYSNRFCDTANFSTVSIPPPTNLTLSCPAPGTTLTSTWTLPSGFTGYYLRGNNSIKGTTWPSDIQVPESTYYTYYCSGVGQTCSIPVTSGNSYTIWVHTRALNTQQWSDAVVGTVSCNGYPVNGMCGSANKNYSSTDTSYGSDTFCSYGSASPSSPAFPVQGGSTSWQCLGQNGGSNAQCAATRDNATFPVNVGLTISSGGSVASSPNGISCGSTCSSSFPKNSTIVLTESPSSSYWQFSGWGGDCSFAGKSKTCTLNIDAQKNVSASFTPKIFNYSEF